LLCLRSCWRRQEGYTQSEHAGEQNLIDDEASLSPVNSRENITTYAISILHAEIRQIKSYLST